MLYKQYHLCFPSVNSNLRVIQIIRFIICYVNKTNSSKSNKSWLQQDYVLRSSISTLLYSHSSLKLKKQKYVSIRQTWPLQAQYRLQSKLQLWLIMQSSSLNWAMSAYSAVSILWLSFCQQAVLPLQWSAQRCSPPLPVWAASPSKALECCITSCRRAVS